MRPPLRPGDRVCHVGEQYAAARHSGTAIVLAVDVRGEVLVMRDVLPAAWAESGWGRVYSWADRATEFVATGDVSTRTCTFHEVDDPDDVEGPLLYCDAHGKHAHPSVYERRDDPIGWCKWHPVDPHERTLP